MFQIRRGGIKGLLVAYPDREFDRICSKHRAMIAYRPSMYKYNGGSTALEVIATSSSTEISSSRLNYSFIIQLLTLGVRIGVRHARALISDSLDIKTNDIDRRVSKSSSAVKLEQSMTCLWTARQLGRS